MLCTHLVYFSLFHHRLTTLGTFGSLSCEQIHGANLSLIEKGAKFLWQSCLLCKWINSLLSPWQMKWRDPFISILVQQVSAIAPSNIAYNAEKYSVWMDIEYYALLLSFNISMYSKNSIYLDFKCCSISIWTRCYKTFFMLNSAENEICSAYKKLNTNNLNFFPGKQSWGWILSC